MKKISNFYVIIKLNSFIYSNNKQIMNVVTILTWMNQTNIDDCALCALNDIATEKKLDVENRRL